jgi:hypothetical protein
MRILATALALALLCGCAGTSTGHNPLGDVDANGIGGTVDGGDGGDIGDAGDAGDAGVDAGPDAGCVARSLSGLAVIDNCLGSGQTGTATVSVADAGNGCTVGITLTTASSPCNGVASGGNNDGFSGTCSSMPCISASLPGTLLCSTGSTSCTIRICDAGVCSP